MTFLLPSPLDVVCRYIHEAHKEKPQVPLMRLIDDLFAALKISGQDEPRSIRMATKAFRQLKRLAEKPREQRLYQIAQEALNPQQIIPDKEARQRMLSLLVNSKEWLFLQFQNALLAKEEEDIEKRIHRLFHTVAKTRTNEMLAITVTHSVATPAAMAFFMRYKKCLNKAATVQQLVDYKAEISNIHAETQDSEIKKLAEQFLSLIYAGLCRIAQRDNHEENLTIIQMEKQHQLNSDFHQNLKIKFMPGYGSFYSHLAKYHRRGKVNEQSNTSLSLKIIKVLDEYRKEQDMLYFTYRMFETSDRAPFLYYSGLRDSPTHLPTAAEFQELFEFRIVQREKLPEEENEEPPEIIPQKPKPKSVKKPRRKKPKPKQKIIPKAKVEEAPFVYPQQKLPFKTYLTHQRIIDRMEMMSQFNNQGINPEGIFSSQAWRHGFPDVLDRFIGVPAYSIQDLWTNPETGRQYQRYCIPGQLDYGNGKYQACVFQFSFAGNLLVHRYAKFLTDEECLNQWADHKNVFDPTPKEALQLEKAMKDAKEKITEALPLYLDKTLGMITINDPKNNITFRIFQVGQ